MKNSVDLTTGEPSKVLTKFCIPMFGSIIFQQLYNLADSFTAGKLIGENALAAVGNSYEITLIYLAFAFGCNISCSVTVSQLFGAKRTAEMKTAIYTSLIMTGAVCALLMAVGLPAGGLLLGLIHTPQEIFADSKVYLDIYTLSLPFVFFYNVATGIFSAVGDSTTPFIFLAASSTANIAADILFVAGFGMGVEGVALATLICQGISCILAVVFVFRRLASFDIKEKAPLFSVRLLVKLLGIAVPSVLQQSFISVGNIIIQGVINSFGAGVTAGYAASVKLNNLVITSLTTLANGVSNFTAQNLGAGKHERISQGFKAACRLVWTICLPITLLYLFAGDKLMLIFLTDPSEDAMQSGLMFLRIVSPFYIIASTKLVSDGVLRGSDNMGSFMAATFTDLILRVALAIVLSGKFGYIGIWSAWPIGWCIATVLSVVLCRKKALNGRHNNNNNA